MCSHLCRNLCIGSGGAHSQAIPNARCRASGTGAGRAHSIVNRVLWRENRPAARRGDSCPRRIGQFPDHGNGAEIRNDSQGTESEDLSLPREGRGAEAGRADIPAGCGLTFVLRGVKEVDRRTAYPMETRPAADWSRGAARPRHPIGSILALLGCLILPRPGPGYLVLMKVAFEYK